MQFYSIVVEENTIKNGEFTKTGRVNILNSKAVEILKSFLTDSITKQYACCPDTIIGILKVFSNQELCDKYKIVPPGSVVELDRDFMNVTLVPDGYQFRVKIPYNKWKNIMKMSRFTEVPIQSN